MSLGATLAYLRDGLSVAEAEARIRDWAARGLVLWSDRETRSTHARPVCPRCTAGVTVGPVLHRCAAGCGWARTARVDVGGR